MLPWIIAASLYVLGTGSMALLVVEWNYGFKPRTAAVIVLWPLAIFFAMAGALLLPIKGSGKA